MSFRNGLENAHGCNEWNTCYEEKMQKKSSGTSSSGRPTAVPTKLNEVKNENIRRALSRF